MSPRFQATLRLTRGENERKQPCGETLEDCTRRFQYWNHPRMRFFIGRENKMPCDSIAYASARLLDDLPGQIFWLYGEAPW
jgi:hypothetical protein